MSLDDLAGLEVAYRPPADAFATSAAGRLARRHGLPDHAALARRAIEDPAWYWAEAAREVGLEWQAPYREALDLAEGVAFPRFFAGGRLNWSEYAVDKWVRAGRGQETALWWEGDGGEHRTMTYAALRDEVTAAAGALRAAGIASGDSVGVLLPMIPEAAVALLAAARLGAVAVPMFSGYGPVAVRDRLANAEVKVLVTCDAFPRRGRPVALKEVADEAAEGVPSLERMLVVRRGGAGAPLQAGRDVWWHDALAAAVPVEVAVPVAPQTPCLLLYTSGSTGRPKGCVHTHGGLPFQCAAEARMGLDVSDTDRILWVTDMGWVMGPYLITAALANGGTAVLFEGVPDWPDPDRLWATVARSGATVLGLSPTLVRALMAHGTDPPARHDLSRLRAIGSTGEAWNTEPWRWCFAHVGGGRVPIVNITGGTEVGGSILSGATYLPAKPASFSGPTLGMDADVVDAHGRPVRGELGELVVRGPWPGMTRGFAEGVERYLRSYWGRFPETWVQGDVAYVDPDGYWFVLGRADDTLKVAGKRLGPAEVESALVDDPRVVEAAAVGVPDPVKGQALVCFVVPADPAAVGGQSPDLQSVVADALGKALAPQAVHLVAALPKTRSGKVMRRIARAAYLGTDGGDTSALDDAAVLDGWPRAAAD